MTENQIKAEKHLKSIRDKVKEFKDMLLEIEALEYAAEGIGAIRYDKEHVDGGQATDRLFIFTSDALEKRAELETLTAEIDELKMNCYHVIRAMKDTDERALLEWHYINAVSMPDITKKLHVSERKAYYIRDDALEHFGEIM